jgi:hypothetical protein
MNHSKYPISPYPAKLPRNDLRQMVRVARLLHKLSQNIAYQALVEKMLPTAAQLNPGHDSVMMCYDFHLDPSGPKLIEVNTNAGGIWYACLSYNPDATVFPEPLGSKLLHTFINEFALFSKNSNTRPGLIVILDEHPQEQSLYSEMQVFATLFRQAGIDVMIADPEACIAKNGGLFIDDKRIDMIYNRHCDFYLKTSAMKKINEAWLNGRVCLSPNPRTYGLLADKQRMILWSDSALLSGLGLTGREITILAETVPETRLLESLSAQEAWGTRKKWVFKPDTGYACRGVYVGAKLTKVKFAELNPRNTLIQQRILPSISQGGDNTMFKTDYRLFAYQDRMLCVTARIYQGQVTNLRTKWVGVWKPLMLRQAQHERLLYAPTAVFRIIVKQIVPPPVFDKALCQIRSMEGLCFQIIFHGNF